MKTKPFDSVPGTIVPAEWAPNFGRVAIHHGHLDFEINHAIWTLMGVSEHIGYAVTQTIRNHTDRLALFLTLAKMKRPEGEHKGFENLVESIALANTDRNLLIHDRFTSGSLGDYHFIIQRPDPLEKNNRQYSVKKESLDDLEKRLFQLRTLLSSAMSGDPRWLVAPLPSPDKSPTRLLKLRNEQKQRLSKPQRQRRSSRP